jgi:hypothetical protein
MTNQQKADKVGMEIAKLEKKYGCKLGTWLTWRDMLRNLEIMRDTPGMDIAQFGVQIQFTYGTELSNKEPSGDTDGA